MLVIFSVGSHIIVSEGDPRTPCLLMKTSRHCFEYWEAFRVYSSRSEYWELGPSSFNRQSDSELLILKLDGMIDFRKEEGALGVSSGQLRLKYIHYRVTACPKRYAYVGCCVRNLVLPVGAA